MERKRRAWERERQKRKTKWRCRAHGPLFKSYLPYNNNNDILFIIYNILFILLIKNSWH